MKIRLIPDMTSHGRLFTQQIERARETERAKLSCVAAASSIQYLLASYTAYTQTVQRGHGNFAVWREKGTSATFSRSFDDQMALGNFLINNIHIFISY